MFRSLSDDLLSLDDFSKVVPILHCMDDYHFGRAYQLPPYSMVVHFLDDYRNMKRLLLSLFLIYLFFSVMALGVLLRIDCVVAAVAPLSATCLISIGGSASFPVSAFSVFPHFPRQRPLISFGFSFFHFPILCAVDLSYAYFAPHLLSFLPNFQVRPPPFTLFFPFWFFLAFVSLKFLFLSVLFSLLTEWWC